MMWQTTSQCCRCCCCQPNIDWTVHDRVENWNVDMEIPAGKMYIKEDASWCGRTMAHCCPAGRATTYTVHAGTTPDGEVLFRHEKPATCSNLPLIFYGDSGPVRCPCCCFLPYLETKGVDGELLGTSRYVCDACLFVPKYDVFDKDDNRVFRVRPETCCAGICVRCKCGGPKGKCCRIPFLIRQPDPPFDQIDDAAITDLWAGMKHECCTKRDMYEVKFPVGGNVQEAMKKVLTGTCLLVDLTFNEQET